jgi:hypothetical protein
MSRGGHAGTVYLLHSGRPYGPPGAPVGSTAKHQAGYAAGEDRRGQAERTVESAPRIVRRGPGQEATRPFEREAG